MTVIASNSAALRAQNGSRLANDALNTAMARLSSGNRINSAADDAAGLAISNSMTSQINGMNQAISNANNGISLAQTADGALSEVTNNLQRIRELAVQSASGTYSDDDRANMQTEVTELQKQIADAMKTQFNGVNLFSTSDQAINIQTGADATDQVALKITGLDMSAVTGTVATGTAAAGLGTALAAGDSRIGTDHVITAEDVAYGAQFTGSGSSPAAVDSSAIGSTVTLKAGDQMYEAATTAGTVTGGVDISTAAGATAALDTLDQAIASVNTTRASLGAGESRLNSVVNSLTNNVTNLTDAKSRISDADFSVETTNLAKAQILNQAATAMLAQANQSQQGVLKLLQ
ncbi:flagellin N-terminal helical domain-containing protein [Sphingomonas oryzagri]|uniref:Flagellin n=1 Tax=Sphingomonas oryzagri TaxID=3042314 RepID=A0ABT6N2V8_9SPHN|nr:flagellin [Sphingomonas oryzagri]MDH7639623.1 flagellin [Sphingomonas oryzagri]